MFVTEVYGNARRYLYNVLVWNERLLKQQHQGRHHHHHQHPHEQQEAHGGVAGEEEAEAVDMGF